MGPFKHTVDDGLDIRKAAFECMYTLLEQGLDRVDIMQFLEHVQAGLKDHYDIKMLTYLMTARLAVLCPNAVIQSENLFYFYHYSIVVFIQTHPQNWTSLSNLCGRRAH